MNWSIKPGKFNLDRKFKSFSFHALVSCSLTAVIAREPENKIYDSARDIGENLSTADYMSPWQH